MEINVKSSAVDPETVAAVKRILERSLVGGSAAVLGRMGLEFSRPQPQISSPFVSPGPSNVPLPVPVPIEQKKPMKKVAEETLIEKGVNTAASGIAGLMDKIRPDAVLGKPSVESRGAWMYPLSLGLPVAATLGGYAITDRILDNRRKQLAQQDADAARKEYEDALNGTSKVAKVVDALADAMLKVANPTVKPNGALGGAPTAADVAHGAAGMWTTAMLASLLTGGGIGYQLTANAAEPKMINKALKDRAKRMWSLQQQPIHFVPAPQPSQPNIKPM